MTVLDPTTAGIVLLDDDRYMLKLLQHMLEHLGYRRVTTCVRSEEALAHITAPGNTVDLIFLDINMPETDGIEFIRRLQACHFGGSVILVSGENSRILESVQKLVQAHGLVALGHLQKPVDRHELARLVGELQPNIGQRGAQRAIPHYYTAEQLREGITCGELVNYYHPKVSLASGEVVGVESLIRWHHPTDGLILPGEFIGIAAEHGLLTQVTGIALAAALRQTKAWLDRGVRLPVAVNVSMDDLMALDFPDRVAALAVSVGVDPQLLTLEVTEGQVMRQRSTVLDVLSRLSLKRFRLAIDDFGTGHSSLAQLRDLPFDELKIDRGFVHKASSDGTRRAICTASLRMAHQLQMQVVAEGIEEEDDWDLLCHLGCDVGQGFLIARPLPAGDVLAWLETREARHGRASLPSA